MANDTPANGTSTPPSEHAQSPTPATSAKRKRSESDSRALSNGDGQFKAAPLTIADVQQTLTAVLEVLKNIDTDPSVLEQVLPASSQESSTDPTPKKVKLSVPEPSASIASKVTSFAYSTLDEFSKDLDVATSLVTASLTPNDASQAPNGFPGGPPMSLANTRTLTGALALQKLARKMLDNERVLHEQCKPAEDRSKEDAAVKEETPAANSNVMEITLEQDGKSSTAGSGGRNVLTLFGNAQGPKQLFSSLQKPASVLGKRSASDLTAEAAVALPIREELLPNMISTTKVLPFDMEDAAPKRRTPTIGEVFREPVGTRQLAPPRPRTSSSRGSTIAWEFPDPRAKRRGSSNHTTTPSSVGQWLGYRGLDAAQEPSSPEAKRKLRDRALSSGEARPQVSEEARAVLEQAKLDALFRSVYSSFAPSRDDAAAIVPAETKDMVWWHKAGERKFVEQFSVDANLIDPSLMDSDVDGSEALQNGDYEAELKEAVENYEPDETPTIGTTEVDPGSKDTDEILKEISELLETLNSYQRIRNASLASSGHARTPSMSSQRETITNLAGSPTSPSTAEVETYNILRSQLTLMINQLPPFAVAKLNGKQLEDLNISKNILFETADYKGVMEEDQYSRLAKAAALNAAASTGRLSQSSANQYTPSGANFGRVPGQATNVRAMSQSYFPQQQPPNRTPSMPIARAGQHSGPQSYQGSSGSRTGFQSQPSFNQSAMRAAATPISANQQQYYGQQKQASYPQYYANSPQTHSQPRNFGPQGAATPSYPPRTPSAGPGQQQAQMYAGYANSPQQAAAGSGSPNALRTASPQKMALAQNNAQLRTLYQSGATPNSTTAPNMQQQQQQRTAQYAATNSAGGTPLSGVGPSGFHTSMSNAEQASLMERQRAQMQMQAQQQRQQQQQQQQQQQGGGAAGSISPAPRGSATPQPAVGA